MATSRRTGGARRTRSGPGEQAGKQRGTIVSHAPGRMRVRLRPEHRDAAAMKEVERQLAGREGIRSVSTDARTGSILVHYDRRGLGKDDLTAMLLDVGVVALDLLGADEVADELQGAGDADRVAPHSAGAVSVLDTLTDLDARISRLTGGRVDLKLLVPAGLGLLALRQIALNGLGLNQVPGYVLLWYTFDSFYKLHQRKSAAAIVRTIEDALGEHAPSDDEAERA